MSSLRRLALRNPALAALIVAAALMLRIVIPAGFMPVMDHGRIIVTLCSGSGGEATMAMAMPGMEHHDEPGGMVKGKCAFADLAQAVTGGADPIQLAAALAFILALALLSSTWPIPAVAAYLRPPLRGPPLPS